MEESPDPVPLLTARQYMVTQSSYVGREVSDDGSYSFGAVPRGRQSSAACEPSSHRRRQLLEVETLDGELDAGHSTAQRPWSKDTGAGVCELSEQVTFEEQALRASTETLSTAYPAGPRTTVDSFASMTASSSGPLERCFSDVSADTDVDSPASQSWQRQARPEWRPSLEPLQAEALLHQSGGHNDSLPTDPNKAFGGGSEAPELSLQGDEEGDDTWELQFLLQSGVGVDQMVKGVLGTSAASAQALPVPGNVGNAEQVASVASQAAANEDLELALWLVGRSFTLDR